MISRTAPQVLIRWLTPATFSLGEKGLAAPTRRLSLWERVGVRASYPALPSLGVQRSFPSPARLTVACERAN
jgi:hypothetical protein